MAQAVLAVFVEEEFDAGFDNAAAVGFAELDGEEVNDERHVFAHGGADDFGGGLGGEGKIAVVAAGDDDGVGRATAGDAEVLPDADGVEGNEGNLVLEEALGEVGGGVGFAGLFDAEDGVTLDGIVHDGEFDLAEVEGFGHGLSGWAGGGAGCRRRGGGVRGPG